MMVEPIFIDGRPVGPGHPTYIVAELSGNHGQSLDQARTMVRAAADAGVDAVKIQTYRPDTMTIDSDEPWFLVGKGTMWEGRTLWDLYREAQTPWEWYEPLRGEAEKSGIQFFSTPFDATSADELDDLGAPVFKIASFEIVDLEFVAHVASKGKPMIVSTGMADLAEIDAVVRAARSGDAGVALLHCNSSYPARYDDLDLRTIPHMAETWGLPVGLSDHTLGYATAVVAVALGATIIEKHFTLSRAKEGPDSAFSMEPHEFADMVRGIRAAENALGGPRYGPTESERPSLAFRRSLFVVRDVAAGERFTRDNVRSIRPSAGMPPKALAAVVGRRARQDIRRGTPLRDELVE